MNINGTLNADDMNYILDKLEQIAEILAKLNDRIEMLDARSSPRSSSSSAKL